MAGRPSMLPQFAPVSMLSTVVSLTVLSATLLLPFLLAQSLVGAYGGALPGDGAAPDARHARRGRAPLVVDLALASRGRSGPPVRASKPSSAVARR